LIFVFNLYIFCHCIYTQSRIANTIIHILKNVCTYIIHYIINCNNYHIILKHAPRNLMTSNTNECMEKEQCAISLALSFSSSLFDIRYWSIHAYICENRLLAPLALKIAKEHHPHSVTSTTTMTFPNMTISRFGLCVAIFSLVRHIEKNESTLSYHIIQNSTQVID